MRRLLLLLGLVIGMSYDNAMGLISNKPAAMNIICRNPGYFHS